MATTAPQGAVFSYGMDNAADLLDSAASVIHFLAEVASSFHTESLENIGLSERGSNGLILILHGVENTINQAAKQL